MMPAEKRDSAAIDIVDAQVHLNLIGGVDAGLAAMDAVGVNALIIDEWWGYDDNGMRRPSYRLGNGAIRHEYPLSTEAAMRYPDRFAYTAWIDRRDPDVDTLVAVVRDNPHQLCIRVVIRPQIGDDVALAANEYDGLLGSAQANGVPVMICLPMIHLPRRVELLRTCVQRFGDLQFVLDHCGVLPMSDDDVAQGFARPESLDAILPLAEFSNVAVKWSLMSMLSSEPFPYGDVLPYLRRFIDAFGAERVMWASDNTQIEPSWAQLLYPVLTAADISEAEKEWILGKTARTILSWPRPA